MRSEKYSFVTKSTCNYLPGYNETMSAIIERHCLAITGCSETSAWPLFIYTNIYGPGFLHLQVVFSSILLCPWDER